MPNSSRKRVLFVAYQFPPAGGIGVHRVVKYVKYLREFGWDASVLTVANPSVPMKDDSLSSDIPVDTNIIRASTWEPGYGWKQKVSSATDQSCGKQRTGFKTHIKSGLRGIANTVFQPDLQVLWGPNAVRAGTRFLNNLRHDAIMATAPPFSSFLVGEKLARRFDLPLMLDYRDEWGISNNYWENKQPNQFSSWMQTRMQHRLLHAAEIAVATTPSSCESVRETAREAGANVRCEYIFNGYDPDDFAPRPSQHQSRKDYGNGTELFRLTYAGTLWNLNPVQPLVDALHALQATSPALLEQLEIVIAGRRTAEQEQVLDQLKRLPCQLVRLPFIGHDEAIQLMQTSDLLTLLNANLPGAERIVNGKIFEYLAAKKPFLLISRPGDMWQLTEDCPYALPCDPNTPEQLSETLAQQLECHRLGVATEADLWDPTIHHRRNRAEELSQLLDEMSANRTVRTNTKAVKLSS